MGANAAVDGCRYIPMAVGGYMCVCVFILASENTNINNGPLHGENLRIDFPLYLSFTLFFHLGFVHILSHYLWCHTFLHDQHKKPDRKSQKSQDRMEKLFYTLHIIHRCDAMNSLNNCWICLIWKRCPHSTRMNGLASDRGYSVKTPPKTVKLLKSLGTAYSRSFIFSSSLLINFVIIVFNVVVVVLFHFAFHGESLKVLRKVVRDNLCSLFYIK